MTADDDDAYDDVDDRHYNKPLFIMIILQCIMQDYLC